MFLSLQRAQSASSLGGGESVAAITLLVYLAFIGLTIAGYWRMLSKAGRPGWAVIVPFYGVVQLLQMTGRSGWWLLAMFVPVLSLFPLIRLAFELPRVFGRGIGFGFGLLFLPFIFAPVLGFGDAEYVGPRTHQEVRSPVLAGA